MQTKSIITATAAALISISSAGAMAQNYDPIRDAPMIESAILEFSKGICEADLAKMNAISSSQFRSMSDGYLAASEYCQDSGGVESVKANIPAFIHDTYEVTGAGYAEADITFKDGSIESTDMGFMWINGEFKLQPSPLAW